MKKQHRHSQPGVAIIYDCIYQAFDTTIGPRISYSGKKWKKYWSPAMQAAARERDRCYGKWNHSIGVEKASWRRKHRDAQRVFRNLVPAAKCLSWKNLCESLENFSKAVGALANIKRRRQCSSTYTHIDGPQASVDAMARHLSTVFDGSILPAPASRSLPPPTTLGQDPFTLPEEGFFTTDMVLTHIKRLPARKAPGSDHLKAEMLQALKTEFFTCKGKKIQKITRELYILEDIYYDKPRYA